MAYETILYEVGDDNVATVTINRPDKLNSFNLQMRSEFVDVYRQIMADDGVNAVVVRAAGDRAFCTGIDVTERADQLQDNRRSANPWIAEDPGEALGPKANHVWKPVVCAVNGMAAGGAFYWINESDIVICADDATFFDPHVTYGMISSLEPAGLARRIPLGEALRWALMGLDERIGAERAHQIGLVSEVVPVADLWDRAHQIAAIIAAKPSVATQGTVKAIWQSLDLTRTTAQQMGMSFTVIGNPLGEQEIDRANVQRPEPFIR
jgi:enoyl-CoA hydratase/carnithine racemase